MNYASKVIEIAEAEVGYLEKKSNSQLDDKTANAGYNNYTKYGRDMHSIYPQVMDFPAAWCDAFVDWCFYKAYGVANAKALLGGNFNDYTVASAQLYKNKNAYHKSNPKVGDQIFFKNASGGICHTGLVYRVSSTTVYTIEGNTSSSGGVVANGGGVFKKQYSLTYSRIDGYGRPKYDEEPIIGWQKDNVGWWYQYSDGSYPKSEWKVIDGKWYYFKADGYMAHDEYIKASDYATTYKLYWVSTNGDWNNKSYRWMQNEVGWWITEIGGEWYPKAEWAKIDDKWYYFDKRGYMLAGITIVIKGKQYTFDKNGVCKTKED